MKYRGTTIICVRKNDEVAIAGDGQVTLGHQIIKNTAMKLRTLFNGKVIAGFAGGTADAMTLYSKLEEKLKMQDPDDDNALERAALELSKDWRMDKMLRRLEAALLVADKKNIFMLTGLGDVLTPEDSDFGGVISIGAGSGYALCAGRALLKHSNLSAHEIAVNTLEITANICTLTNSHISSLKL